MSSAGTDPRHRIARLRLRNQRLAGPPADAAPLRTAADVVAWMGAVQAQEYPYARWSVGQRANGVPDDAAVDAALARGDIVRTHVMRDTWHFVTRSDARWLLRLTGPRIQARNGTMYRKIGLDAAQLAKTDALLADVLSGGVQLTRRALAGELAQRGVVADGFRLGYILMHAELEEAICSGARQGKHHTYALFDDRVPPAPPFDRDEALAEAVRRFFTSHGPATVKDFTWWSYLTVADARRGLDLVGDEFVPIEIDGRTYWSAAGDTGVTPRRGTHRAHLLQVYDEYVIAYRESRDILDVDQLAGQLPGGRVMFLHAVILDGQVIGHWRRQITKTAVVVETQILRPLGKAEAAAVEEAVARHAAFMGLPADWVPADGPTPRTSLPAWSRERPARVRHGCALSFWRS